MLSLVAGLASCSTGRNPSPGESPLATDWTITAPAAGATNSVRVMFPAPIDRSVLESLIVLGPNGRPLPGDALIGHGELMWSFTPKAAWPAGDYQLVVGAAPTGAHFRVR